MILKVDMYDVAVHCFVGDKASDMKKKIRRRKAKDGKGLPVTKGDVDCFAETIKSEALGFAYELEESKGHFIFWVKEYNGSPLSICTVVHELIHIAIAIFSRIGSNINDETEEPFCYLHDYLVRQVIDWLEEKDNVYTTKNTKGGLVQVQTTVPESNPQIKGEN